MASSSPAVLRAQIRRRLPTNDSLETTSEGVLSGVEASGFAWEGRGSGLARAEGDGSYEDDAPSAPTVSILKQRSQQYAEGAPAAAPAVAPTASVTPPPAGALRKLRRASKEWGGYAQRLSRTPDQWLRLTYG